ncbi:MAG: type II secretion system protein GspM [Acidiferrobacterales bacterium]
MAFYDKTLMQAVTYWRQRSRREKLIVMVAAGLVLVSIIYNIIWLPMQKSITSMRTAVPTYARQLEQMKSQARQIPTLATRNNLATTDEILSTIEKSLDTHALRQYMSKMELDRNSGAKLTLKNVNYSNLLKWILNLDRQYGIKVKSAKLNAAGIPGEINAVIVFVVRS